VHAVVLRHDHEATEAGRILGSERLRELSYFSWGMH